MSFRDMLRGCMVWAGLGVYCLATFLGWLLLHALGYSWGFEPSVYGGILVGMIAAALVAFTILPFGLWRRANRIRLRAAWQGERAVHLFAMSGRICGLLGVGLLAESIQLAHRWGYLQDTWERAVPFGIVIAVFIGTGVSESLRKVFPAFGVVAAIVIALPVASHGAGAWKPMVAPAIALLVAGGGIILLWSGLRASKDAGSAQTDPVQEGSAKAAPARAPEPPPSGLLVGVLIVMLLAGAWLMSKFSPDAITVALWGLGFLSSILFATVIEFVVVLLAGT